MDRVEIDAYNATIASDYIDEEQSLGGAADCLSTGATNFDNFDRNDRIFT